MQTTALHPRSQKAWDEFRARIEETGGTVVEPTWLGSLKPHRIICANGHEGRPTPNNVQRGQGICLACVGRDPKVSEAKFLARLAAVGATPDYLRWEGAQRPHRIRCALGHEVSPWPSSVISGQGVCKTCAGRDPEASEKTFRVAVTAAGAELLEGWKGTREPHHIRCAQGHHAWPRPSGVRSGSNVCAECVRPSAPVLWARFCATVEAAGGQVLEEKWRGAGRSHRVRCALGHEIGTYPSYVRTGGGICAKCARPDGEMSWAEFVTLIRAQGGEVREPKWLKSNEPHRVRCPQGHETKTRPSHVRQGIGMCATCAGKTWDVFYVVSTPDESQVKLGITSGDPRPRLRNHRRDGLTETLLLRTNLPEGLARDVEREILDELARRGHAAVLRREYFGTDAIPVMLALAEQFLPE